MWDSLVNGLQSAADICLDLKKYSQVASKTPMQIIAHRGSVDAQDGRVENSFAALDHAQALGAWGIEFDVRFTRDQVPIILHDPDLARLFGVKEHVANLTFAELQKIAPQVASLTNVLRLQKLHFMIEIKTDLTTAQEQILQKELSHLRPIYDYHLLTLDPRRIRLNDHMPSQAWILVGDIFLNSLVELSLQEELGGVAGHYLFMTRKIVERLHKNHQHAGVGFVPTKNLLHRELARSVDWIFTNRLSQLV